MPLNKIKLTPRSQDYAQWYLDVAQAGQLFEYSPTPGCITFLPRATSLWEKIHAHVDAKLKRLGVQNLILPALIPLSFFEKEKEHVEGFAPELAVVTHGGGKELEEKLAFRPTSEVMFCDFFKKQLQSYRDLPILANQWVNVLRWEKRTRPFLRTAEFHWQEGHTLHETPEEARKFAERILHEVYISTMRDLLAIEGIAGFKSQSERFAGADATMTYEPMMSNGWALQICTSHVLGKGFMESFDVSFTGRDGVQTHPAYTSWGMSTRSIGGIISSHSDDRGLVIPPRLAEYRATLLPLYGKDPSTIEGYTRTILRALWHSESELVSAGGQSFFAARNAVDAYLIDTREARLGEKITDWELSGSPVRVEYGERDMAENKCVVASRITGEKIPVPLDQLTRIITEMHDKWQSTLLENSRARIQNNTVACTTIDEIGHAIDWGKFALYNWDLHPLLESEIKDRFKATTRCLPFAGQWTDRLLGKEAGKEMVVIARAF